MDNIYEVNIKDVVVGNRIRGSFFEEEIKSLKKSIEVDVLLQPIIINQDNKLIAGHRRYVSCKELGFSKIQCKKVDTRSELHETLLEVRENNEVEDFTFYEKMKAADLIEPICKGKG